MIFVHILWRKWRGLQGGVSWVWRGWNSRKKIKLRADPFHHTHEVWGPCNYKNTSLRGLAGRVLASYWYFHFWPRLTFIFDLLWPPLSSQWSRMSSKEVKLMTSVDLLFWPPMTSDELPVEVKKKSLHSEMTCKVHPFFILLFRERVRMDHTLGLWCSPYGNNNAHVTSFLRCLIESHGACGKNLKSGSILLLM